MPETQANEKKCVSEDERCEFERRKKLFNFLLPSLINKIARKAMKTAQPIAINLIEPFLKFRLEN
jgi:hypothetical protein